MMQIIHGIRELRGILQSARAQGQEIAFVPTMGNLHPGHIALVTQARQLAPFTVVSIFVNPFQFGAGEDFQTYPRTLEDDIAKLQAVGADLLFLPDASDLYPNGLDAITRIQVPDIDQILCGQSRPTFFRGVTTVVGMLFNLVWPDYAVFGEKDYQQLVIIRRMVSDLKMPIRIIPGPTVRETDGLAMSSRNGYLDPAEREIAPILYRTLSEAGDSLAAGEPVHTIRQQRIQTLTAAGFRPDYFEIRRAADLSLVDEASSDSPQHHDQDLRILVAAWLGKTRLIDNIGVRGPA
uniref:Pantothenate synthetase n=1 Tax=Candidatus Kentrum sp. MB TaxID=2138164 RepID=A0A450XN07_9GAMM|nr:MAG: pantothenate synthetase [Candidatus Kentron sp. MB]VFK30730.1 MAG: pantothenate synthetase [Candidatus Kentron sp. MB]VFK75330.1 MAG: pantothenate synthetase [Candidatus Kentron sp. MB]